MLVDCAQLPENRGIEDIFIDWTDNMPGFDAIINVTLPQTEIQNSSIHQLRDSSKPQGSEGHMADLNVIHAAVDKQAVIDTFEERCDK